MHVASLPDQWVNHGIILACHKLYCSVLDLCNCTSLRVNIVGNLLIKVN